MFKNKKIEFIILKKKFDGLIENRYANLIKKFLQK